MRGYKIFGPDYTCRGYKYALNEPSVYNGSIELCRSGFHFCIYARDCRNYYQINDTNTYAIVESGDNYITKEDKVVCDSLTIVKTLTKDEFLRHVNNGEHKTWWHTNNHLWVETTYVNGNRHGSYKTWHDNGRLWMETTYVDGNRHGSYKEWDNSGKLRTEITYVNGKIHGSYKSWYDNGQLSMEIDYVDGNIHGSYKTWYNNGQLWEYSTYVDGQIDGNSKLWDEQGELITEIDDDYM